jgi:hypothetical protein
MSHCLTPHVLIDSVLDLGIPQIRALELEAIILDVDCTLKSYSAATCTPEVTAWVATLLEAGLRVCLVSNGREGRIARFAEGLGVPYIAKAFKPMPWGVLAAMRRLGARREQTAMVGDQLFADILAGRLAGVLTILVRPIRPEEEPWFTRLKRRPETFLLRRLEVRKKSSCRRQTPSP